MVVVLMLLIVSMFSTGCSQLLFQLDTRVEVFQILAGITPLPALDCWPCAYWKTLQPDQQQQEARSSSRSSAWMAATALWVVLRSVVVLVAVFGMFPAMETRVVDLGRASLGSVPYAPADVLGVRRDELASVRLSHQLLD